MILNLPIISPTVKKPIVSAVITPTVVRVATSKFRILVKKLEGLLTAVSATL